MEPTPPKRQDDLSAVHAATKVKEMRQKIRLGKNTVTTAALEKLHIGKLFLICLQTQPNSILHFLHWGTQTPSSGGCKDDDSADSSLGTTPPPQGLHPLSFCSICWVNLDFISQPTHCLTPELPWRVVVNKKKKKKLSLRNKIHFFQFQMEVSSLVGVMGHNHWHYNSIKGKEIISVSPSLHHRASFLFLLADLCNKAVSLEELNILRR